MSVDTYCVVVTFHPISTFIILQRTQKIELTEKLNDKFEFQINIFFSVLDPKQ